MRPREAMGPEAALLSARLAAYRPLRVYHGLEMPAETSLYVEACARSLLRPDVRRDRLAPLRRLAARLRGRVRVPREVSTPSLEAAPVVAGCRDPGLPATAGLAEALAVELTR